MYQHLLRIQLFDLENIIRYQPNTNDIAPDKILTLKESSTRWLSEPKNMMRYQPVQRPCGPRH